MSTIHVLAVAMVATVAAACATVPAGKAPLSPPPAHSLSGTWVLTTETVVGAHAANATFTQIGEHLSGKVTSNRGEVPVVGKVKGDSVVFGMSVNVLGRQMHIDYAGTVTGDKMSGTVKLGAFPDGKWTCTRKPQ